MSGAARSFWAMGTEWWVDCDRPDLLGRVERVVRDVEARLSRFRDDSALSVLNRRRWAVDPVLAQVVSTAARMQQLTGGAFDPTVGAELIALGYDRDLAEVDSPVAVARPLRARPLRVSVRGHEVRLWGDGRLDLGGIAKGWTVDLLHDALRQAGAGRVLVDGGGDLRGTGDWPIGVGEDAAIHLDGGLATSSVLRRSWRLATGESMHHVIDPSTGVSAASTVVTATLRAPDATTADALATALLVAPGPTVERLAELGASAWVTDRDGQEWMSRGWEVAA